MSYTLDEVQAMASEFHNLTGGRLEAVLLSDRSDAVQIQNSREGGFYRGLETVADLASLIDILKYLKEEV